MSWAVRNLGEQLLTHEGLKPTQEVLQSTKVLAIYFSAHWCPPCRQFTPILAEYYPDFSKFNSLTIVFASSDKDKQSFDSYYEEQPWEAVPYPSTDIINVLSQRFAVRGIPTLVVVDAETGDIIDKDGRNTVSSARGNFSLIATKWNLE